jgi:hypothetical protein
MWPASAGNVQAGAAACMAARVCWRSDMQDGLAWAACKDLQAAAASDRVAQVVDVPAGRKCADGDRIGQDGAGAWLPAFRRAGRPRVQVASLPSRALLQAGDDGVVWGKGEGFLPNGCSDGHCPFVLF